MVTIQNMKLRHPNISFSYGFSRPIEEKTFKGEVPISPYIIPSV
jgi:hypothetical protein